MSVDKNIASWPIVRMPLSKLKPAGYNPRTISEKSLAGLTESIKKFGYVEPIVWNKRTGNIVGGHQRFKVLESQGVAETEVTVVDYDESEEVALNITLNNPHIQGEYGDGLKQLLLEVKPEELQFDELRLDQLLDKENLRDRPDLSGSLGRKFLVPPFSFLDTAHTLWTDRVEYWKGLGVKKVADGTGDPVVFELSYLWFSPPKARVMGVDISGDIGLCVAEQTGRSYLNDLGSSKSDMADLLMVDYRGDADESIKDAVTHLVDNRFIVVMPRRLQDEGKVVDLLMGCGLTYYNEIVLMVPCPNTDQFDSERLLKNRHVKMLVFVKGDSRLASDACGDVTIPKQSEIEASI